MEILPPRKNFASAIKIWMLQFVMDKYLITGASGSIASAVIGKLEKEKKSAQLVSRRQIENFNPQNMSFVRSKDYLNLDILADRNKLLICNGTFNVGKFEDSEISFLGDQVYANFTVVLQILIQFLRKTDKCATRDVYILGSSAAYDRGPNVATYSACKTALRALVESLNKEYASTDTRFCVISTGTVDNEMGLKVPDQLKDTLIDTQDLANQIFEIMTHKGNTYQPEVLIRRRQMQVHR